MLKISSAQRESITMRKPKNLEILRGMVCLVYDIQVFQLVLTYENDEEETNFLASESEYSMIISSKRDYLISTYIKPLSRTPKLIGLSVVSMLLTYALMKFATIKSLTVSISNNSEHMFAFIVDLIEVLIILCKALLHGSYWIPFFGSMGYFLYLTLRWVRDFFRSRKISTGKIVYTAVFLFSYLPNVIGYALSMVMIIWFVLVFFHVLLHRIKPRTEKDKSFLKILSLMIISIVPRIIYFY